MDDSHATGFIGKRGIGTHEYAGLGSRIDFITSTFGKALGGATGGFIVSKKKNIEFLRQRSRNYIFSNSLAPVIVGVNSFAIDFIKSHPELRRKLWENTKRFREGMKKAGFEVSKTEHPIVPIILGDAKTSKKWQRSFWGRGFTSSVFHIPLCPRERRG